MKRPFFLALLLLIPLPSLAQERVKFPVGVSSKVLGYGHLWAAWRRGYFEHEGLDAEVVLMRGTAPAVQALIAGSIYSPASQQDAVQARICDRKGSEAGLAEARSSSSRFP